MKWTDPKLIDPGAGSDAELFCTDGIAPSWICYGGALPQGVVLLCQGA